MNTILNQMLSKYTLKNKEDYINALKEVIQEIALSALAKTDFFEYAAFYGSTALRIFYGLDRFSEDLDFSLIEKSDFDLTKYFKTLDDTFKMYGLSFTATKKEKTIDSSIQSAFLKRNTLEHVLLISTNKDIFGHIQKNEVIKIKFEIDTNPPQGATFEYKYGLLPSPYRIRIYDESSLFAGKIHALLCRSWDKRVKGRDLYDYIFYLSHRIQPNINHLKERLIDSGKWNKNDDLTLEKLKSILIEKFEYINYDLAKKDVIHFINDPTKLNLWDKNFFKEITLFNLKDK